MSINVIMLTFSLSVVEAIFQPISPIFQPIILNYARAKRIAKNYASITGIDTGFLAWGGGTIIIYG